MSDLTSSIRPAPLSAQNMLGFTGNPFVHEALVHVAASQAKSNKASLAANIDGQKKAAVEGVDYTTTTPEEFSRFVAAHPEYAKAKAAFEAANAPRGGIWEFLFGGRENGMFTYTDPDGHLDFQYRPGVGFWGNRINTQTLTCPGYKLRVVEHTHPYPYGPASMRFSYADPGPSTDRDIPTSFWPDMRDAFSIVHGYPQFRRGEQGIDFFYGPNAGLPRR